MLNSLKDRAQSFAASFATRAPAFYQNHENAFQLAAYTVGPAALAYTIFTPWVAASVGLGGAAVLSGVREDKPTEGVVCGMALTAAALMASYVIFSDRNTKTELIEILNKSCWKPNAEMTIKADGKTWTAKIPNNLSIQGYMIDFPAVPEILPRHEHTSTYEVTTTVRTYWRGAEQKVTEKITLPARGGIWNPQSAKFYLNGTQHTLKCE